METFTLIASRVFIFLCLVTVCDAYTYTGRGYTPGAWPASNVSPRALGGLDARNWDDAAPTGGTKRIGSLKDIWAGDIYHGLWEKTVISQNIAAGSNLVKATWYRTERANLVAFKQAFPGIATGFVDFAETPSSVASYMTTSLTQVLPTFTVSNLLIRAGLPTNYLTYTPYRMIGGYGSLDGAVTPSNVQAGFNVKDYGWDGLKRMITNLTCTQVVPDCRVAESYGDPYWLGASTNPAPAYADAKSLADASASLPIEVSGNRGCRSGEFPYYWAKVQTPSHTYSAVAEARNLSYTYTNKNPTHVARIVELYGSVTNDYVAAAGHTSEGFNNYGSGLTEGPWHLIESESLSAGASYSRTRWGTYMTTPTWSSDPSPPSPFETHAGQYTVLGLFLLNRWTCYY